MKDFPSFFLTLVLLSSSVLTFAQKERTAEAEVSFTYPSDITLREAKRRAAEEAKAEAILSVFPGTIEAVNNSFHVTSSDGLSSNRFQTTGISELRGIWMRDLEKPTFTGPVCDDDGELCTIRCRVKGKVQEIKWNKPEFEWSLMRNHVEEEALASEFQEQDRLFMTFQAPCDGYLAVFIVNDEDYAQCLVPNDEDGQGVYPVKRGKKYVFFSSQHDNQDGMMPTNELVLYANGREEINSFYVFFSPNLFRLPTHTRERRTVQLFDSNYELPADVSWEAFQKWQQKMLTRDDEFQREYKNIVIRKID